MVHGGWGCPWWDDGQCWARALFCITCLAVLSQYDSGRTTGNSIDSGDDSPRAVSNLRRSRLASRHQMFWHFPTECPKKILTEPDFQVALHPGESRVTGRRLDASRAS